MFVLCTALSAIQWVFRSMWIRVHRTSIIVACNAAESQANRDGLPSCSFSCTVVVDVEMSAAVAMRLGGFHISHIGEMKVMGLEPFQPT
jgi:hypothetical protein